MFSSLTIPKINEVVSCFERIAGIFFWAVLFIGVLTIYIIVGTFVYEHVASLREILKPFLKLVIFLFLLAAFADGKNDYHYL